jgi:hypothetical protein
MDRAPMMMLKMPKTVDLSGEARGERRGGARAVGVADFNFRYYFGGGMGRRALGNGRSAPNMSDILACARRHLPTCCRSIELDI